MARVDVYCSRGKGDEKYSCDVGAERVGVDEIEVRLDDDWFSYWSGAGELATEGVYCFIHSFRSGDKKLMCFDDEERVEPEEAWAKAQGGVIERRFGYFRD